MVAARFDDTSGNTDAVPQLVWDEWHVGEVDCAER